ncbi:MAG: hydroxymethylbilane synthase [Pirellulaceae bacterium]|nr:hydroxymethylbilane synthase [Pirellulaceae bacterium]
MWQAEHVASLLEQRGIATVLVPLVSSGDVDMRPIDGTRQVGVFTKRIQLALIDDEADVAVHSLKDLPTEVDSRLMLAAVPARETVNDCLVSQAAWTLDQLPASARIGTGSKRRAAQLLHARPDLLIHPIRGNVQTRLEKLDSGQYDAIVLANAGLLRLEMHELSRTEFTLDQMLPAPGQGALGIEVRSDDANALAALQTIDDAATHAAVTAERTLLARLNGGCLAPIAALANCTSTQSPEQDAPAAILNQLNLRAIVLSTDGRKKLVQSGSCELDAVAAETWADSAAELAADVSERLAADGALELIRQAR